MADCSVVEKTGVAIINSRVGGVVVSVGSPSGLWPKEVGIKKLVKRTPSTKIIENVYRDTREFTLTKFGNNNHSGSATATGSGGRSGRRSATATGNKPLTLTALLDSTLQAGISPHELRSVAIEALAAEGRT